MRSESDHYTSRGGVGQPVDAAAARRGRAQGKCDTLPTLSDWLTVHSYYSATSMSLADLGTKRALMVRPNRTVGELQSFTPEPTSKKFLPKSLKMLLDVPWLLVGFIQISNSSLIDLSI
jgi:hypothetical protein